MSGARAPLLYEVAARPWLARLSARHGRRVTLGDVPVGELQALAERGFDFLWPMGVWRTGAVAAALAWREPWLRERWREAFADVAVPELVGSPFAVAEYVVEEDLGGDEGLDRLRRRLAEVGVGLVLDFVPHHTATDAPWVDDHPEWYVSGSDAQRAADPAGYFDRPMAGARRWLAHCRDPYFPPWTDAAPLDFRSRSVRAAMASQLLAVARRCDGVRADMAMLVLDDVFRSTWAERSVPPAEDGPSGEFWLDAIALLRRERPGFVVIGEAYWGLEWRLQQLGFDHTYDKTFYDRLVAGDGAALAAHLGADEDFQRHSVRFLENHDEPRAASSLSPSRERAGAVLAATAPGMFLIHDGQLEGARVRSPVQFARWPDEPADLDLQAFYARLLEVLRDSGLRAGTSIRLDPAPAWDGNPTNEAFVARLWTKPGGAHHLGVVNLGGTRGQCRLPIPEPWLAGHPVVLEDLLGDARFERAGDELVAPGLYLDMANEAYHLFRIR
jgi:hypothetical protein